MYLSRCELCEVYMHIGESVQAEHRQDTLTQRYSHVSPSPRYPCIPYVYIYIPIYTLYTAVPQVQWKSLLYAAAPCHVCSCGWCYLRRQSRLPTTCPPPLASSVGAQKLCTGPPAHAHHPYSGICS